MKVTKLSKIVTIINQREREMQVDQRSSDNKGGGTGKSPYPWIGEKEACVLVAEISVLNL